MVKTRLFFFIVLMPLFCLSGCYWSRETDETAYVIAMGFDKGEQENLVVTLSVANPKVIAGMSSGSDSENGAESVIVQSVETYGPITSLEQMSAATSRHLSLLHAKAFIFSEEVAREGLDQWFTTLNRYHELRSTAYVFVCRGKAKDFLEKNRPPLELSPTKQYEQIGRLSEAHGLYRNVMFKDFYQDLKSWSTQPVIPLTAIHEGEFETAKPGVNNDGQLTLGRYIAGEVPISGDNKAQFDGSAIFQRGQMVDTIDGEDTRFYLMMRGFFENGFFIVLDPLADKPTGIGLNIHQARNPSYKVSFLDDGTVTIDVNIFLEADLAAMLSETNYESAELKPFLEEEVSRHIQTGCQTLVERTQQDFNADIFGFGKQLKRYFLTTHEWRDYDWPQKYSEAQIQVYVQVRVKRTGMMIKTNPVGEVGN